MFNERWMPPQYSIPKRTWSEADFEQMGWHDARLWGLAFLRDEFELVLDIDYILKWVEHQSDQIPYQFWVMPATLVFQNAYDVEIDLAPYPDLSIDRITRDEPGTPRNAAFIGKDTDWRWTVACHEGDIGLRAAGYQQYLRGEPVFTSKQFLSLQQRGGVSFARPAV